MRRSAERTLLRYVADNSRTGNGVVPWEMVEGEARRGHFFERPGPEQNGLSWEKDREWNHQLDSLGDLWELEQRQYIAINRTSDGRPGEVGLASEGWRGLDDLEDWPCRLLEVVGRSFVFLMLVSVGAAVVTTWVLSI